MKLNLKGRIEHTPVSPDNVLMPLFECIINSIQGIEDASEPNGKILIRLLRDGEPELQFEEGGKESINSLEIIDNGIGFTARNFDSFNTADSDYKFSKGGKGVGRFTWLVVFKTVHVESIFFDDDSYYRRDFDFLPEEPGTHNDIVTKLEGSQNRSTIIRLGNIQSKFKLNKRASTLADRIFEHFLIFLLSDQCPKIELIDGQDKIEINNMLGDKNQLVQKTEEFVIRGKYFIVNLIKLYGAQEQSHKVFLCANGREVESKALKNFLPDLPAGRIPEHDGAREFMCLATITSSYFDDNLNPERTMLLIPESGQLFEDQISKEEILSNFQKIIDGFLGPSLEKYSNEKKTIVKSFIENEAPQYRALLNEKYIKYINEMPYTENTEKLEMQLHKIKYEIDATTRVKVSEMLRTTVDESHYKEFNEEATNLLSEVSELSKSALAEYIIHRKLILDLFEKKLKITDDDTYELEKTIHEVIFPLRATSDDIDSRHNLWMVDERLSYHKYLASDMPFDEMSEVQVESRNRPDLIIFNGSSALSESDDQPYNSIVIIEFKKPMRRSIGEEDNPIAQVYKYIRNIRSGSALTKSGRPVRLANEDIPFFCYILCDITPKIKQYADDADLNITPDRLGYFGYSKAYSAYVEIISYDKLLIDAKKRNRILFDKLGLK